MKSIYLSPIHVNQKSFWGKAIVAYSQTTNEQFLISYGTLVASCRQEDVFRYSDYYSQTTMKHINEFFRQFAINSSGESKTFTKKQWLSIPLTPISHFKTLYDMENGNPNAELQQPEKRQDVSSLISQSLKGDAENQESQNFTFPQFSSIREVSVMVNELSPSYNVEPQKLQKPGEVAEAFRQIFSQWKDGKERSVVLFADAKLRCVGYNVVSVGNSTSVDCDPVQIFRPAVVAGTNRIYIAHNHPSNDATFSNADIKAAERLIKAGEIVGVTVLDFMAVTSYGGFSSYRLQCSTCA